MSLSEINGQPAARGVYCLANDEALEWFQALVRSFRKYNPTLPLTVIPYNSSLARLKTLQEEFQFSIMEPAAYTRFDAIADRVAGQHLPGGTFRKLCCFFGQYDTFLFLDSDIVVTQNFDALFQAFEPGPYDFVYFDTDLTKVYTPEFARKMVAEYHSPGFNSGAFLTRRAAVSEAEILAAVASGEKIRGCFSIWGEQPFLNYLLDVTRRRLAHVNLLLPELAMKPWARMPLAYDAARSQFVDGAGRPMPFIHWAGCEWPTMYRPDIFLRYRTLGLGGGARLGYRLNFYYHRCRRNLKAALRKNPWLAGWVARRDERLREKKRPAANNP
jgi:hypothetical protein